MDNDQLVLSLMELTNLPIEEAKRYLAAAENILEVAIQNYYDAQQEGESNDQVAAESSYEEEEIRAPLPREFSQLVQEESVRR